MPKFPVIKPRQVITALEKAGFRQVRQKGSHVQTKIEINANEFNGFIKDPNILYPIRLFNLRLMKKGTCVRKNNHCLDLADRLV
jgi:hypothetical protein